MALNLGAMISAARSQRNPAGEAITNYQNMDMISNILKNAGVRGEMQPTPDQAAEQPVENVVPQQNSDAAQKAGLWEIIKRAFV